MTATVTLAPTQTPTYTPSAAPSPTRQKATTTPSPTGPAATATTRRYPAPQLANPGDGASLSGKANFSWSSDGPPLAADQHFDLRIWSDKEKNLAEEQRRGVIAPTKGTQASQVNLADAPAIQEYGNGTYYWSVVVVKKSCATCPGLV